MIINNIYSKAIRRVRKRLLQVLEYSYQNEDLDAVEAKLIASACKELVTCYFGIPVPDKVYDRVGKEVAKAIDKVNLRLQKKLNKRLNK